MLSIPSVVMNGLTFTLVIIRPFIAPNKVPTPRPAINATHGLSSWYVISRAADMAETAIREPTERSIPPLTITIVMPIAIMPMVLIPLATLNRFTGFKKYGLANDIITHSTTSAAKTPDSLDEKTRLITALKVGRFLPFVVVTSSWVASLITPPTISFR
jgi:hypothetical protein